MPNIMTDFEHLKLMDGNALLIRRAAIIQAAESQKGPSGESPFQTDDQLIELVAIARALRGKTSAPKLTGTKRAAAPTLDAL